MSFVLKQYQEASLARIREYLRCAADPLCGCDKAFTRITGRHYLSQHLPAELRPVPYVCVRVPTGGGKTILAAHAVGIAAQEYLQIERCLVLWLAPTTAIVDQTISALQTRSHPYWQALESAFGGNVEVLRMDDAHAMTRGTVEGSTVIIVSTLSSPRAQDQSDRRIYGQNGDLMPHFSGIPVNISANLLHENGIPVYSLANVIRLHRPLVIVDEAHNAKTPLAMETLARFAPSCILEFTATPDQENNPSNILYHVSASELKAEQMVKLPINLTISSQWREAVSAALDRRQRLENVAIEEERLTGEYIRPIILFQAQAKSQDRDTVTVEVLRRSLIDEFNIPAEQIAEATGAKSDLPSDILERVCPIRFILTVSKLREGWDCPYAYVLCTVANSTSSTAVEQILGRVLRLPRAQRKTQEELNYAYAFSASDKFEEAAKSLADVLVEKCGFEKFEAKTFVMPTQPLLPSVESSDILSVPVPRGELIIEKEISDALADVISVLPDELKSRFYPAAPEERLTSDKKTTTSSPAISPVVYQGGALTDQEASELRKAAKTQIEKQAAEKLIRKTRKQPVYPAAVGVRLSVPVLAYRQGTFLERFEDQFREAPWNLAECDPALSEKDFSSDPKAKSGSIDLDEAGKIRLQQLEQLRQQLTFNDICGPRSHSELAAWLDSSIDHPDIMQAQSGLFLYRLVEYLIKNRQLSLEFLIANRYRLRDAASQKIDEYRHSVVTKAYQLMLSPDFKSPLEVDSAFAFSFPLSDYPASRFYEGVYQYSKHYYQFPAAMNDEEARCAALIDSFPKVETWVRNLERQPGNAFWLQTSTDKFYPDFVARLTDKRLLVVEYKGEAWLDTADTREKQALGELWAARSKGKCLFFMVGKAEVENDFLRSLA